MASILCLDPRTTNIDPPKKLYRPHKSVEEALKSDWENVGKDMWKAIEKVNKEIEK